MKVKSGCSILTCSICGDFTHAIKKVMKTSKITNACVYICEKCAKLMVREFYQDHKLIELKKYIKDKCYQYDSLNPFTLFSGKKSEHYFNLKPLLQDKRALTIVSYEIIDRMINNKTLNNVKGVGGPPMGAIPIADAIMLNSTQTMSRYLVRKDKKGYGVGGKVEFNLSRGDEIIIVDDVLTTGKAILEVIEEMQDRCFIVNGVFVILDREEGGTEALKGKVPFVDSLFTKKDFTY